MKDTSAAFSMVLGQPDLSELMSQIIASGKEGERLVFVEYDPATRAFYDHVGLPTDEAKPMRDRLADAQEASHSCGEFLKKLSNSSGMVAGLQYVFPGKLATMAGLLLTHRLDIALLDTIADEEQLTKHDRFLLCLARSQEGNKSDWDWLKSRKKEDMYELFHWLIQRTPQRRGQGGAGKRKAHQWEQVLNVWTGDMEGFPELAGLEYVFGMRTAIPNYHARFNVFLETGEYAGQMIAFANTMTTTNKGERDNLMQKAVEAATLVRRVIPSVRQARYMDAILSGGEAGELEHVLVQYLPTLIPIKEFYVCSVDSESEWAHFFDGPQVFFHQSADTDSSSNVETAFRPFTDEIWKKRKAPGHLSEHIADAGNCHRGFAHPNQDIHAVVLGFSISLAARPGKRLAVLVVTDAEFLPDRLCELWTSQARTFEDAFENPNTWVLADGRLSIPSRNGSSEPDCAAISLPQELLIRSSSVSTLWSRYLETQLSTVLGVVLEPRRPLYRRQAQAGKEGRTYREQYGTAIYGKSYLDVEHPEERWSESSISDDIRDVLKVVRHTQAKLTDSLYGPRGYRAIAKVVFDHFFCPLWGHFRLPGDPRKKKEKAEEKKGQKPADGSTALGSLVREALDFEDTLRLEGGYREHFVHSYHVFLLGLYLIEKLHIERRFSRALLRTWFLTSMYHDIAYPIQKMKTITSKYLDRLNPGIEGQVGNDMAIDVSIGFGKLLASGLLGSRLRVITDTLVDTLFPETTDRLDESRKKQVEGLAEHLRKNYDGMKLATYKQGIKESLYQYCLNLALTCGEHGILSALLFDMAARDSGLPIHQIRNEVSVAILGHHMLDKKGDWKLTDHWTFGRSKPRTSGKSEPGKATGSKKDMGRNACDKALETARSIAWDPSFLLYDLRLNNKNTSLLGSLLILCDSVSQWGRTDDETDGKLALLRNRDEQEKALVVLCYPRTRKRSDALEFRDHYENQLMHITGPAASKDEKIENGFVRLAYNCPNYPNDSPRPISAELCDDCKRLSPMVKEKIGVIPLTCEPRSFPDVLQAHEEIDREASEKKEGK